MPAERALHPPAGEPLTHFFQCWRFPDHHACAAELIERQSRDNDRLMVAADKARREAADAAAAERTRLLAVIDAFECPCGEQDCTGRDTLAALTGVLAEEPK